MSKKKSNNKKHKFRTLKPYQLKQREDKAKRGRKSEMEKFPFVKKKYKEVNTNGEEK